MGFCPIHFLLIVKENEKASQHFEFLQNCFTLTQENSSIIWQKHFLLEFTAVNLEAI